MKLYFANEDAETCHSLECHLDMARCEGLTEITLFEAIPEKVDDLRACKFHGLVDADGCGRVCNDYDPRNGKSGICKYQGRLYSHGKEVTLKIEDLREGV